MRLALLSPLCLIGHFTSVPAQAPSPAPTFSEPCHVCGDPDLTVDPLLSVMLSNETFLCSDVELAAQANLFSPDECNLLQTLVPNQCNCGLSQTETAAPSPAPSYTEPCFVCGDPALMVDPTLAVDINDEVYTCADVEDAFQGTQIFSPLECDFLVSRVTESCNCRSSLSEPPVASPAPVMPATTSSPARATPSLRPPTLSPTDSPVSSNKPPSIIVYVLSALAVVSIGAGALFCWKRSTAAKNPSRKSGPDLETSIDPSPTDRHGPSKPHAGPSNLHTVQSRGGSSTFATASAPSGGGGEEKREDDDTRSRSTRASIDPTGIASRHVRRPSLPSPHRGPESSSRPSAPFDDGSYMPSAKDQCRSVAVNQREPVMVEAIPIDMDH